MLKLFMYKLFFANGRDRLINKISLLTILQSHLTFCVQNQQYNIFVDLNKRFFFLNSKNPSVKVAINFVYSNNYYVCRSLIKLVCYTITVFGVPYILSYYVR